MKMLSDDIRLYIIRPTLTKLDLWSEASEKLLLGTGMIETGFSALKQIKGPALGFWQIEPATHHDIKTHLHIVDKDLRSKVYDLCNMINLPADDELISNLKYGCAIARIIYHRSPAPMPQFNDNAGFAEIYKKVYNTELGKAKYDRIIEVFEGIK